jgi:hypothetical protein
MEAMAVTTAATEDEDRTDEARTRVAASPVLSTAEIAACTCPESCERDHDRD